MKGISKRQQEILDFLIDCVRTQRPVPTLQEIADHFGIASVSAARAHLDALERKGALMRRPGQSRGIELSAENQPAAAGIPIVGRVAAGCPILAVENLDGYLSFDSLFSTLNGLYALRVRGDSMVDAGIWDGDYVVVREQGRLENGEIGVALVDEEATVKRIFIEGDTARLMPCNEAYEPIVVNLLLQNFRIGGKVVGVHRIVK